MRRWWRRPRTAPARWLSLLAAGMAAAGPAFAVDYSLSGFATLGYAISDKPYAYQRFISDEGTFQRDSVAGVQADISFNANFGATVQAKIGPVNDSDSKVRATLPWLFASWRPTNDWLVRVGKLRVPLYLNSENTDVGATFDLARLPVEMYSVSPTTDFTGASFSRTFATGVGELSVDGYWGKTHAPFRIFLRDDIAPAQQRGPIFVDARIEAYGLALTLRRDEDVYRLGVHRGIAKPRGTPLVDTFPFVPLAPGLGYYQTSSQLPGPGVVTADEIDNLIVTVGADVRLPAGLRLVAELAKRSVSGSRVAPEATGGYVALLRPIGAFTPYVSYAQLRSSKEVRDLYAAINNNRLPEFFPGAQQINLAQRAGADGIAAYDQYSMALGLAWAVARGQKAKFEFQQVRSHAVSALIDAPAGGESGARSINILSLSYSVVF